MEKIGICLLNLGTPASPDPKHVGKYLREFLMDPLVVDIPFLFRWFLVNVVIVPRRSRASGLLYKKVWTAEGSPLLTNTLRLAEKFQQKVGADILVIPAMRYGSPSIRSALEAFQRAGVTRLLVCPLYPQYSLAATESSVRKVERVHRDLAMTAKLEFLPEFYNNSYYLDSVAEVSADYLKTPHDKVIFSFHGLPERQVKKTDRSGSHCLLTEKCCETIVDVNRKCYRAQCYSTAKQIAKRLGVSNYEVAFQSRLGRTPWIKPYTDAFYRELPRLGVKRVVVISPSFVADCLETLEEIQIRGEEEFREHGGETLELVPSLNSQDIWVENLYHMLKKQFLF